MKRTLFTGIFTAIATTAAMADPGHFDAAGHGHSHWTAYGILAGVAAVAAGMWLARASGKAKRA